MTNAQPILAAGAVLWRAATVPPAGRHSAPDELAGVEIAVLHRDRYDDWSLPKGKVDDDETLLACAVREIAEETGAEVAVEQSLGVVHYSAAGRPKEVAYWSMRYLGGEFEPNEETDELRWLPFDEARALLSYPLDGEVLERFAASARPDSVILLVRHAKAGKRSQWPGPDAERPLESAGQKQARRLTPFALRFAPERLIAANRARCTQTFGPVQESTAMPLEIDDAFNDEAYLDSAKQAGLDLLALAVPGARIALCSQGTFIPGVLADLVSGLDDAAARTLGLAGRPLPADFSTSKGAAWLLCFAGGELVGLDYYPVSDI